MDTLTTIITVLGGLGLFLYGMKVMSEGLQMAAGEHMRTVLSKVTSNRVIGVLTGFSITAIIQSSSATTVMLVSFVNAGLINLTQSIGIILGANIGTTVTGWLVALLGFKMKIAAFALPAIAIGFFIRFIKNEKATHIGDILVGFGILFLGLEIMKDSVGTLNGSNAVLSFMSSFHADTVFHTIIVVIIGTAVTMVIQSSSATMAMTMTLLASGLIDYTTACALVLGENIGTTITANIASVGASVAAKRTARVHLMFNVFGVIWVLMVFRHVFLPLVDFMVPGNPVAVSGSSDPASQVILANHLAAFHTTFNITNTLIFLPFINALAWLATKMVKEAEGGAEPFHLKFISTVLLATPSININQARLEAKRMLDTCQEMFTQVVELYRNPDVKMNDIIDSIQHKENMVDLFEKEISDFLIKISQNNISVDQSHAVSSLLHTVNELERIGDMCESLTRNIQKKYEKGHIFSDGAHEALLELADRVYDFLKLISDNFTDENDIMTRADVIENRINELRREARKKHIKRLNKGKCDVVTGLVYIDMLTCLEKIGDHAYNVAESVSGRRIF